MSKVWLFFLVKMDFDSQKLTRVKITKNKKARKVSAFCVMVILFHFQTYILFSLLLLFVPNGMVY